jgi:hypothetical protein
MRNLSFPADLEDGQTFDVDHEGTQSSYFAVHCKAADTLSKVYSSLYVPCLSPYDYKSLKDDFEERKKSLESKYDIESMMDFVDPQVNEDIISCDYREKPFTIVNCGQK